MSGGGPSVLVIGGGVIGCAVAWRLAGRGAAVTVLDREAAGGPASHAAGGMLSPLGEAEEPGPFLDLGLRSLDRYPSFVHGVEASAGMEVGYRTDGRLDVALNDREAAALRRRAEAQSAAGYACDLLDPPALRARAPGVTSEAVLGLSTAHDHQVDAERLTRAVRAAAEAAGARILAGAGAADVIVRDGRARGVRTDAGDALESDAVVVAAGAWSGRLELPTPLPVRPVRGQIVVLRADPPPLDRVTWATGCYLIPRSDGRLLVGATAEDAGYTVHAAAGGTRDLLTRALRLVPALEDAAVAGLQVGLRPDTPDHMPIIGRDPAVEGLYHATGHYRNGILLAPETAEVVTSMILDDVPGPVAFGVSRFQASPQGSAASRNASK